MSRLVVALVAFAVMVPVTIYAPLWVSIPVAAIGWAAIRRSERWRR